MGVKQRFSFSFELALAALPGRAFVFAIEAQSGQFFFQEGASATGSSSGTCRAL
jgi:hypothetical protein